jgi:hypothetical protein
MNLRTTFNIEPSVNKIGYNTPVLFIGSCFASEIGARLEEGRMPVLINPSGVVYNPVSAGNTIDILLENKEFGPGDIYKYNGTSLSFLHSTEFSSENEFRALDKMNSAVRNGSLFLKKAGFLFITFGTAWVYRFSENGEIVSNCHKMPSSFFSRELLSVDSIAGAWTDTLDRLHAFNKEIRIIFTVSPVRHWKDGAHANQVSKSILFLAIEKLLGHKIVEGYFPAYELVMDDLRDYRFYADDMLHPSTVAVDYIWKGFSDCYLTDQTISTWKEVQSISKAINHRFLSDSSLAKREFASKMLKKISSIEKRCQGIDLSEERSYFTTIIQH